jgi:hypothetical protein
VASVATTIKLVVLSSNISRASVEPQAATAAV